MASAPDFAAIAEHLDVETEVERSPTGELVPEDEEEQTSCACPSVNFVFGDSADAGPGTLYITSRRVVWLGPSQSFSLNYKQIIMHAVARDASAFAKPCIYLQLDIGSEDMQDAEGEEEGEEAEGQVDVAAEVRLVPQDETKVEEIFKALCDCAALNPDSDIEEDGAGEFYFNEEEVYNNLDEATRAQLLAARVQGGMELEEGAEEGYEAMEEGEQAGNGDDGRFEDVEEDEGEEQ